VGSGSGGEGWGAREDRNFVVVENACREADFLIEAVPEEMELKLELFTLFDKFAKPKAVLASNTSSLSVADMAEMTYRPELCVGMHFFNPVPKMRLD